MQSERTSLKNQLLKDRYAVEMTMLSKKNAVWTWNRTVSMSVKQSLSYFLEHKKSVQEMIATQQSRVHNTSFTNTVWNLTIWQFQGC